MSAITASPQEDPQHHGRPFVPVDDAATYFLWLYFIATHTVNMQI